MIWQSTPGSNTGKTIKTVTEYVLVYAKDIKQNLVNTIKIMMIKNMICLMNTKKSVENIS